MTDPAVHADTDVTGATDRPARRPSIEALGSRLARLRRRTGFRVTDRVLLFAGSVLLPLGVVLVLLGWYGASHTTRLFEEIPYLISGGMLGVVFAIAGGFCYFGYFLARLVATMREVLDSLLRIEERMEAAPGAVGTIGAVGAVGAVSANGSAAGKAATLVATRTGTMFHRPECPLVADRSRAELRRVADGDGLEPCGVCLPTPSA